MVSGLYTSDTTDKTAQLTGEAIGKARQLQDVIDTLETFGIEETED